ncbi:AMSH/STAMBP protein ubiquitin specific-protease [Malassezia yamatoensis]|uniref:AMSH/STAMBP protein ubiquitin specific-protease n=1 Tax=Malassezia yamatoensis TaxID=253288 RepID=A0AAJ5YRW3_9BASI|nr:AMSH/STAMBP protein ubiquitin specific-protease [Malassezia yamatoensis]
MVDAATTLDESSGTSGAPQFSKAEAKSNQGAPDGPAAVQSNEQWLMRLNRDGLPVCKDLHGLYTTMLISLSDRWPDWRYKLAFVLAAAVQRMQALQFVQIVRDSAGGMQNMLSLSQIKTSFIMSNDTAWKICQAFVDACLMEKQERSDGDVFIPTPKGLHLVDRFVTRHGIATRSVSNLLNMHDVCDKILFLERDEQDDVLLSDAVIRIVFHRLVGLGPNRTEPSALGVAMTPTQARDASGAFYETAKFTSTDALSWLVNFSTLVSMDEAAVLLAHMVRLGWIQAELRLAPEQSIRVAMVRIEDDTLSDGEAREGQFVEGEIYHVTEKGASVAWHFDWDESVLSNDMPLRPPTSMSDAVKEHNMHSISPRIDTSELYNEYNQRDRTADQSLSPLQHPSKHLSPYMGMTPLSNTSPVIGQPSLSRQGSSFRPRPAFQASGTAAYTSQETNSGNPITGLGLDLDPQDLDTNRQSTYASKSRTFVPAPEESNASHAQNREAPLNYPNADVPQSVPTSSAGLESVRQAPGQFVDNQSRFEAAPPLTQGSLGLPSYIKDLGVTSRATEPPKSAVQDPRSLSAIINDVSLRRAFYSFLTACGDEKSLLLWCQVEWFRNDCRAVSCGNMPTSLVDSAVEQLPPRNDAQALRNGPAERFRLREVLEQRAKSRFASFLAADTWNALNIDGTGFLKAIEAYTAPSTRLPSEPQEAARESEKQLARLLLQCGNVQKQVYARLAERPRRQFLAARGEL